MLFMVPGSEAQSSKISISSETFFYLNLTLCFGEKCPFIRPAVDLERYILPPDA
jgi:hypothetical protein